jgi:hypothetical protein
LVHFFEEGDEFDIDVFVVFFKFSLENFQVVQEFAESDLNVGIVQVGVVEAFDQISGQVFDFHAIFDQTGGVGGCGYIEDGLKFVVEVTQNFQEINNDALDDVGKATLSCGVVHAEPGEEFIETFANLVDANDEMFFDFIEAHDIEATQDHLDFSQFLDEIDEVDTIDVLAVEKIFLVELLDDGVDEFQQVTNFPGEDFDVLPVVGEVADAEGQVGGEFADLDHVGVEIEVIEFLQSLNIVFGVQNMLVC